jgi:hypothetical protein
MKKTLLSRFFLYFHVNRGWVAGAILLFVLLFAAFAVASAQRGSSVRYTDAVTIEVTQSIDIPDGPSLNTGTYIAGEASDTNREYQLNGASSSNIIRVADPINDPGSATAITTRGGPGANRPHTLDIAITNTSASNIYFRWLDSENIVSVVTNELYVRDGNVFLQQGTSCPNELRPDGNSPDTGRFREVETITRQVPDGPRDTRTVTECDPGEQMTVGIGDTQFADAEVGQGADTSGFVESPDEQTTCEDAGGGFAWAFCGALRVFSWALDYIDQSLEGWLRMSRERFDSTELRDAWVVIRNIAYLLLVPAMLVMIIGTALGFEFVSAYTVKSALPRMVAATIFIALSYDLSVFFVDVVQAIGDGIHNILLFPFRDILDWVTLERGTTLSEIAVRPSDGLGGAAAGTALSAGILALAGVAAASVAGGGIIATVAGFIGLALLALLAVFVLLLARQTLIVALILFSPIAILAWIFPGRTRIFSLWNKTFWLMMWFYPVIMVTTAVGKIMAALVISGA